METQKALSGKEYLRKFLASISDPVEREEWIKYFGENYEKEKIERRMRRKDYFLKNPEALKKYQEQAREAGRTKEERAVITRNPHIAFDLFEGKYTYPIRKKKGEGWGYYDGNNYKCRSCKKSGYYKPGNDCTSENHYASYSARLERKRRKSNKYYEVL